MSTGLYNTDILTLAQLLRDGSLSSPDVTVRRVAKLCGSEIDLDMSMRDGVVTEYAQRVRACALGQASAAILADAVIGASRVEIVQARDALRDMLKADGAGPTGRFSKLGQLKDVRAYPARHQSVMLPWEAIVQAVEENSGCGADSASI